MAILIIPTIWILSAIGIFIIKKIEPDDKIYLAWALFVDLAFTAFVLYYWFG